MLGEVFDGRYRIDALLGAGGIGEVYSAEHLTLGRQVALKVLLPEHEDTPLLRRRFEREAEALSGLNHPHIVSITDVGVSGDTPFLVMELLEGTTLADHLQTSSIAPDEAFAITRQILSAMSYAHARGIAHRDLKPQNIFVTRVGDGSLHVTVLDFGLARFLDDEQRPGTKLTRKGALLGTPAYMAPEQAAGGRVDERADVYAAGLILYELLCGRRPFDSKNAVELRRAHLVEPPPRMSDVDPGLEVDDALEELVERALAKQADDRFEDAAAMLAALDALVAGSARRSSPQHRAAVVEPPTPNGVADTIDASVQPAPAPAPEPVPEPAPEPAPAPAPEPAPAAAPDAKPLPAPARVPSLVLALGAAVVLVVFGGLVAGLFLHFSDEETVSEGPLAETTPAHDDPSTPEPRTPPPPRRSRDPLGDLPPELQPFLDILESGGALSRPQEGVLNRWGRAHPDDPRSRLLLARNHTATRSLSYAFPLYQEALEIDPNTRRWSPMLEDLLEMARSNTLAGPAADLIVATYGSEAVPTVEAQLEQRRRPIETQRMERLLVRLNAAP